MKDKKYQVEEITDDLQESWLYKILLVFFMIIRVSI